MSAQRAYLIDIDLLTGKWFFFHLQPTYLATYMHKPSKARDAVVNPLVAIGLEGS